MRIPLISEKPRVTGGSRCVACQGAIHGGPVVRIRGMQFHRGCATYKQRTERVRR